MNSLVYQVVCLRNGKEHLYDVEGTHYKVDSSKTVTLYRGEQPVGTFFDVACVRAIKTGPVVADPELGESLSVLIEKSKQDDDPLPPYWGLVP